MAEVGPFGGYTGEGKLGPFRGRWRCRLPAGGGSPHVTNPGGPASEMRLDLPGFTRLGSGLGLGLELGLGLGPRQPRGHRAHPAG